MRVLIERLVQDGQDHERDAVAARGDLGEGLQQVYIATGGLLRGVLQRLARLVDYQQQAGAGRRGDRLDRFLEAPDDVGRRTAGERRSRPVQVPLDGLQDRWLRAPPLRPDGFQRGTQRLEQERVQRRTLRRQDRRIERLAR